MMKREPDLAHAEGLEALWRAAASSSGASPYCALQHTLGSTSCVPLASAAIPAHGCVQIPTKVEVFILPPGADQQQQQQQQQDGSPPVPSKRLGYLSFDSNERSGHQARELKSVHVSIDAVALRLVVHRCHVNKLNIYNQVGWGCRWPWCINHAPILGPSQQAHI